MNEKIREKMLFRGLCIGGPHVVVVSQVFAVRPPRTMTPLMRMYAVDKPQWQLSHVCSPTCSGKV